MNRDVSACFFESKTNRWALFQAPESVHWSTDPGSVVSTLALVESCVKERGLWAVGWVSYEAAPAFDPSFTVRPSQHFPLIWFALFRAPVFSNHCPLMPVPGSPFPAWRASEGKERYLANIQQILARIRGGDTYQVNYSFRLNSLGSFNEHSLFCEMIKAQAGAYSTFIDAGEWSILSASPELLFRMDRNQLTCRPMKGTERRGETEQEDRVLSAMLQSSAKDRAENVMIVDMVRNDLSRIALRGSVRVPELYRIESFPTVHQMTSTVTAESQSSVTEIFRALFPSASITGAPKVETMRIIAACESTPRHIYTGAIGFITRELTQFNVAIRTALVDRRRGCVEYGVGSGVVWDSDPEAEYEECQQKATIVTGSAPRFDLLETLRWVPDKGYDRIDLHMRRLQAGAASFGFTMDPSYVRAELVERSLRFPRKIRRVRLTLTAQGQVAIDDADVVPLPSPYRVSLAKSPVTSTDIFLRSKTTYRLVYDTAEPIDLTAHDVVLWNERGELTESRIANLILEIDGALYTPASSSGLLPGVFRSQLVETGKVAERVLYLSDLAQAQNVFLVNSLRGMWNVTVVDGR